MADRLWPERDPVIFVIGFTNNGLPGQATCSASCPEPVRHCRS